MPDINTINGLVLCDETNVNGVTIANINNIDGITKSCVECNEILLGRSTEDCTTACNARCAIYFTDASGVPTTGDHIYITDDCSCDGEQPTFTYYSNKCGERSGLCFTVDSNCQVGPRNNCGR